MRSIYQFTTFKIIPPKFMDKMLVYLGMQKDDAVGATDGSGEKNDKVKRMLAEDEKYHHEHDDEELSNMSEAGYTKGSGIVKNLNVMIFGFLILLILIIFVAVARLIMRKLS